METKDFGEGEVIFREGDEAPSVYRILTGKVGLSKAVDGSPRVLALLGEGDIFGEMALFLDVPRAATAQTMAPTKVEVMTEAEFNALILQDPQRLIPYLSHYFAWLRQFVEAMAGEERFLHVAPQLQTPSAEREATPVITAVSSDRKHHHLRLIAASDLTRERSPQAELEVKRFPFRMGRLEFSGEKKGHLLPNLFRHNDFEIRDRAPFQVSRNHCSIERHGDRFFVRDRGSRMGTIVNGKRISHNSQFSQAELRAGENQLVLGTAASQIRYTLTLDLKDNPKKEKELATLQTEIDKAIADGQLTQAEMQRIKSLIYADKKVTTEEAALVMTLLEKVSQGDVTIAG